MSLVISWNLLHFWCPYPSIMDNRASPRFYKVGNLDHTGSRTAQKQALQMKARSNDGLLEWRCTNDESRRPVSLVSPMRLLHHCYHMYHVLNLRQMQEVPEPCPSGSHHGKFKSDDQPNLGGRNEKGNYNGKTKTLGTRTKNNGVWISEE